MIETKVVPSALGALWQPRPSGIVNLTHDKQPKKEKAEGSDGSDERPSARLTLWRNKSA